MSNFKINLRKDTFYINGSGSVIGDICYCVDDWFFPEKSWDDFVATILYWLSQKIIKLNFNANQTLEVDFMEGCFKIALSLDNQGQCTVKFIEGEKLAGDEEVIHKTINIPFEDLKSEVKKACEVLLHMKETKELDFEEEYQELKESYETLCKF